MPSPFGLRQERRRHRRATLPLRAPVRVAGSFLGACLPAAAWTPRPSWILPQACPSRHSSSSGEHPGGHTPALWTAACHANRPGCSATSTLLPPPALQAWRVAVLPWRGGARQEAGLHPRQGAQGRSACLWPSPWASSLAVRQQPTLWYAAQLHARARLYQGCSKLRSCRLNQALHSFAVPLVLPRCRCTR